MINNFTPKTSQKSNQEMTYGTVLSDGTIVETIFDPIKEKCQFIAYKDGNFSLVSSVTDPQTEKVYRPILDVFVQKGIVVLPTQWADPGPIETLLGDIQQYIYKNCDIPQGYIEIASRYVLMTWVFDRFSRVPYLRFKGLYGTGKSWILTVIRQICYRGLNLGASVTSANIFRMVDQVRGTTFIDEGNFPLTTNKADIIQVLNKGYERDAFIFRTNPQTNKSQAYDAFGPKVIANNSDFDDYACESRMLTCITRVTKRRDIPKSLPEPHRWEEAIGIRNRLLGFRMKFYWTSFSDQEVDGLDGFSPRFAEILRPLFQTTGERKVPDTLSDYLAEMNERRLAREENSVEALISREILQTKFLEKGRCYPKEISDGLAAKGYKLSPEEIAGKLTDLSLVPLNRTKKGRPYLITPEAVEMIKGRFSISDN